MTSFTPNAYFSFPKFVLVLVCFVGVNRSVEVVSSYYRVGKEYQDLDGKHVISVMSTTSELECALLCNGVKKCVVASFHQGVCRLHGNTGKQSAFSSRTKAKTGKVTNIRKLGNFDSKTNHFVGSDDPRTTTPLYRSCHDAFNKSKISGVYRIALSDGTEAQVYCVMDIIPGCVRDGWALAMKIDGTKPTFTFDAPYWTNQLSLNYPEHLADLDQVEMKSPIIWRMRVNKLCLGMSNNNTTSWLQIELTKTSLQSLFAGDRYRATSLGVSSWKQLLRGSSLLGACTKEGLNLSVGASNSAIKLRIGIVGSRRTCDQPNSFIGFGASIVTSSGNVVMLNHQIKRSFGYILVQ